MQSPSMLHQFGLMPKQRPTISLSRVQLLAPSGRDALINIKKTLLKTVS